MRFLEFKKRMKFYIELFEYFIILIKTFLKDEYLKMFLSSTKLNFLKKTLSELDIQYKYIKNVEFLQWLKIFLKAFS